ncbi:hypothetical protein J422_06932 [Methanocaldococcus villosus KIN24-T80]|uniref:Class III signal peptide-containing protein n=1 Tax=Methanocaldococcus villosus KIN24-T80 TaxID=1069083 RepID=N6VR48_9EURY|nr:class III signal peptide-containing protein [Methanocaldococcus villosus]ENN95601.1 hypothetical protein J422_06932 [Methanocaldococcus villosus KIN24-T80]
MILSKRAQLSLEFSLLLTVVILSAIIVGYYLITSAIHVKDTNIDLINKTSRIIESYLSKVS